LLDPSQGFESGTDEAIKQPVADEYRLFLIVRVIDKLARRMDCA
jgi:hypothetical protein